MSNKKKKGLVPELRFPEFIKYDEWEEKNLINACDMQAGKFVRSAEIKDKQEDVLFPCFGGNGLRGFTKSFTHEGEYSLIGRQGALCGNVTLANGKFHATEHAVVVTPKKRIDTHWLYYELIRLNLNQYATGQAQPGLSVENLERVRTNIPSHEEEQQKIAACLSSLDELIAAHTQKHQALQSYKKGLMQNLFPAEGETVPALRFPEFENSKNWELKRLNQISSAIFDGTHQTPKYTESGIPFFSVENIVSNKTNKFISRDDYLLATNKNKPEKGDVLVTRIGNIGFSAVVAWDYEFSIYVTLAAIKKDKKFISGYLHGYMQSERYQREIQSKSLLNAVPCKINMDELRKTEVLLPSLEEQQKIADCLSFVDDLITAQVQKIEELKAHKKGLMQKLFPAIGEVVA